MDKELQFRILGPIEACVGDRPLPIGRPRAKALLGYMVTTVDRVVSTEHLVDALWGGSPPATARAQIQADISWLRRAFDGHRDRVEISTSSPGYILRLPAGTVDVDEFRRDVVQAREAASSGNHTDARTLFRRALGRWRGRALEGVTAAYADPARAALEQNWLVTHEQLADVELVLGRHHDLIPVLTALVEADPLREFLACRLMLALYRCGRQSDALQMARRVRVALIEREGLDPGKSLVELESAILRADPSLDDRSIA